MLNYFTSISSVWPLSTPRSSNFSKHHTRMVLLLFGFGYSLIHETSGFENRDCLLVVKWGHKLTVVRHGQAVDATRRGVTQRAD